MKRQANCFFTPKNGKFILSQKALSDTIVLLFPLVKTLVKRLMVCFKNKGIIFFDRYFGETQQGDPHYAKRKD
ncbi:MAG: hypothetical protein D3911_12105 [Candidatus Electrothrix sp. AW3_4]|nr:hypothetical protein [Candidatus Electrothrix gigas]